MLGTFKGHDEQGRLKALERYAILDMLEDPVFDTLVMLVRQALDVPMASVSLIDQARQWFKALAGLEQLETERCNSFCTHAITGIAPLHIEDARLDARVAEICLVTKTPHIRAYLGIPLCTPDGYIIGTLCAMDTVPRRFTDFEVDILRHFASLTTDALEVRSALSVDRLTGLVGHRAWIDKAEQSLSAMLGRGGIGGLCLIDIDHLHKINASHGPTGGDAAIQTVARLCRHALRDCDQLGRVGGEEFALLMPHLEQASALAAAERIRAYIEAMSPDLGDLGTVTVSIGVAGLPVPNEGIEGALERADQALMEAKLGGRNRVGSAPPAAALGGLPALRTRHPHTSRSTSCNFM